MTDQSSPGAVQNRSSILLIDREIERLVKEKEIIFPFDPNLLSGCTYDLRAGAHLSSRNRLRRFDLSKGEYVIESGECVTIHSLETINFREVPIFGSIGNKHTILAKGLFHPSTTIDPGFKGPLALTFINMGNVRYKVSMGDRIAKLELVQLADEPDRIYGENQRPSHREGSTDIALIVDSPEHRDDDDELEKMYGAPVAKLYSYLREYRNSSELWNRRVREERGKWYRTVVLSISCTFVGAIVGVAAREEWPTLKLYIKNMIAWLQGNP